MEGLRWYCAGVGVAAGELVSVVLYTVHWVFACPHTVLSRTSLFWLFPVRCHTSSNLYVMSMHMQCDQASHLEGESMAWTAAFWRGVPAVAVMTERV